MGPVPLQKNGEAEEVKKSNGMPCPVQMMKVSEKEVWRSECVVKLDRYSPFVLPFGLTVRQIV